MFGDDRNKKIWRGRLRYREDRHARRRRRLSHQRKQQPSGAETPSSCQRISANGEERVAQHTSFEFEFNSNTICLLLIVRDENCE
jgi:hypothetical protein